MGTITLKGWAFVPGPAVATVVPFSSTDVYDIATYAISAVAGAFLEIPGFRLVHPPMPTWYEWEARWERDNRALALRMSQFEDPNHSWGGSEFSAVCEPFDILAILRAIHQKFPRVWLHNAECEVHSPDSFSRLYAS